MKEIKYWPGAIRLAQQKKKHDWNTYIALGIVATLFYLIY